MKATFSHDGYEYTLTNEHAASSYGQPVLLLSANRLTDAVVTYEPDECGCTILALLADIRGIHNGPETRRQLSRLAEEMEVNVSRGADYDRVIEEFIARGTVTDD
jgi:hypothetical protein